MKFEKDDVVQFSYKKRTFWEKLDKPFSRKPIIYMTSYVGQGNIKNSFEIQDGDKFKVLEFVGFLMLVEPIDQNKPMDNYSISISSVLFQNRATFNKI